MTGNVPQLSLDLGHELVVDLFAGGGGTSLGLEWALGRPVDVAVNHDAQAVAMHQANHPETEHFCESVFKVNPIKVTRGLPVGLLWASPDCTHHSKAKGGKPVSTKRRGLAWVVVKWARRTRPRVIMLENVEEFRGWGPLDENGRPCKRRKGQQFDEWIHQLERLGYKVEHRLLRACDYGAPTIRRRLFLIARRDGRPIVWPEPTHAPADEPRVKRGKLRPYRTAAECIDWSIPAPSIFTRKKPLAENTLRRIAKGVQRFVLENPAPFLVPSDTLEGEDPARWQCAAGEPYGLPTPGSFGGLENREEVLAKPATYIAPFVAKHRANSVGSAGNEPVHTITAGGHQEKRPGTGNAMSLVVPYFIPRHGERPGQEPRTRSVLQPHPAVTTTANGATLVAAFMEQANTGMVGHRMTAPVSTIVQKGSTQRLVHAHLLNLKGSDRRHQDLRGPAPSQQAQGTHASLVAALMAPYYGSGSGETGRDLRGPAPTVTTKDRLQLVTVNIDGTTYVLTDIGMRMLQPRELFRAQGFPDSYIIDRGADGQRLAKHAQVRMCGNSVPPQLPAAIAAANFAHERAVAA